MPVNASNSTWTPARLETLVQFWSDGLSATQIANHLGGVTRSAVLGKAFRLNLVKRRTLTSVERKRPKKASEPRIRWRPVDRAPEVSLPPPDFIGIPLLETTRFSCMYPEGEGSAIMFCGQQRKDGSSFCAGHHRICYHRVDHEKRKQFVIAA